MNAVDNDIAGIISSWPTTTRRVLCAPGILIVSVARIQPGEVGPSRGHKSAQTLQRIFSRPDNTLRFDVEKGGRTHHLGRTERLD